MLPVSMFLDAVEQHLLTQYCNSRFVTGHGFKYPEAFCLIEQAYIKDISVVRKMLEEAYGQELEEPIQSIVPERFVTRYYKTGLVPMSYNTTTNELVLAKVPEIELEEQINEETYRVKVVDVQLYTYLKAYLYHYGKHPDLAPVPAKETFSIIVKEGLSLGAADITISTRGHEAIVYYNVRKKKIYSNKVIYASDIKDIIIYITKNNPYDFDSKFPMRLGIDLDDNFRGRVLINKKYKGYMITIRTLPKAMFDEKVEDLGFREHAQKFYKEIFMNNENGLRIIAGETMSGKNTIASALLIRELGLRDMKCVSIEMPVERELPGIEQIDCDDPAEYQQNIQGLIRMNPDLVYVAEIDDATGKNVVEVANTDKRVVSTIHGNSPSGVISRLSDITKYSFNRIISSMQSIVYQKLLRNEETDSLYPVCKYVYFSRKRKQELLLLSDAEKLVKIDEWEEGDDEI